MGMRLTPSPKGLGPIQPYHDLISRKSLIKSRLIKEGFNRIQDHVWLLILGDKSLCFSPSRENEKDWILNSSSSWVAVVLVVLRISL